MVVMLMVLWVPVSGNMPLDVRADLGPRPVFRKLRLFSGKTPPNSGEVDFETWRLQARQMLDDASMSEGNKKITIIQSLLRPALDTVSSVSRGSTSDECVQMLTTIYGRVEDGHDLIVAFHTTYQDDKETASNYLNRLYLLLVEAADRGGLPVTGIPQYLLRQFIRGCADDSFVQRLNLEAMQTPPGFGNFLLLVRKEECRRTEKRIRLKRASNTTTSQPCSKTQNEARPRDRTSELEVQLQQLTSKFEALQSATTPPLKTASSPAQTFNPTETNSRSSQPRRPYFCYKCGIDGHRRANCHKAANPELVYQRLNNLN
jgi:hypothetical protein